MNMSTFNLKFFRKFFKYGMMRSAKADRILLFLKSFRIILIRIMLLLSLNLCGSYISGFHHSICFPSLILPLLSVVTLDHFLKKPEEGVTFSLCLIGLASATISLLSHIVPFSLRLIGLASATKPRQLSSELPLHAFQSTPHRLSLCNRTVS